MQSRTHLSISQSINQSPLGACTSAAEVVAVDALVVVVVAAAAVVVVVTAVAASGNFVVVVAVLVVVVVAAASGDFVGPWVGFSEGSAVVDLTVGVSEGNDVGVSEGNDVGLSLELTEGVDEGEEVGSVVVVSSVGFIDGASEGIGVVGDNSVEP